MTDTTRRTPLSLRLDDATDRALDELVALQRERYLELSVTFPPAAGWAENVTRSSAIRDLLLAWHSGADVFDRNRSPDASPIARLAAELGKRAAS